MLRYRKRNRRVNELKSGLIRKDNIKCVEQKSRINRMERM